MSIDSTPVGQSAELGIVTSLLSRQDEVIAELELLEARILNVIEDLSAQRKSENENEEADLIQVKAQQTELEKKKPLTKAASSVRD